MFENAKSPSHLLDMARFAHREGDRMRKHGTTHEEIAKGNEVLGKVEQTYNHLLNRQMDNPFLLFLLAVLNQQRGNNGLAANMATIAIERLTEERKTLDSAQIRMLIGQTYATLGYALRGEGRRDKCEWAFKQAVEISPDDALVLSGFAGLYVNDGNPQKCIDLINRAQKLDPEMTGDHWNLALAHLELKHWKTGFEFYHQGVEGRERLNFNYWAVGQTPTWDGSTDQTVVVYGEQGIGDEIMFASCLNELIRDCRKVIFDCHPRLVEIFKRSFPDVEVHGTRKVNEIEWARNRTDIDAKIAIGSLPMFYRRKDSDFPKHDGYIEADSGRSDHYRKRLENLGAGPYVGIAWSGGGKKTRFDLRSIPLAQWAPILEQDATFVSLHYMPEAGADARAAGVPHWENVIDNLDKMHSLIEACDLIITVNQSLVHQAGALGKTCWTLTPSRPAWRYHLSGSKMLWYPSVRQFRQRGNDWIPVITDVAGRLKAFIGKYNERGHSGARAEPERVAAGG